MVDFIICSSIWYMVYNVNANTPTMEAPRKKKKGTKHVKAIFDDAGCTGFYKASPCVSKK